MYILYHDDSSKVSIWVDDNEHNHETTKKEFGINEATKKQIEFLFKSGVKTAARIKNVLRDCLDPFRPKKLESDPDIPNELYIPGLIMPSSLQINNFLNNTLKVKLNGKSNFCYGDLCEWVSKNETVPDFEHEPFVIAHDIQVNDKAPQTSQIRLSISTKYLLSLAMKTKHICADSTYKLIWHGFPVLITGKYNIIT